jgi:hypothetical protein
MTSQEADDIYVNNEYTDFPGGMSPYQDTSDRQQERGRNLVKDPKKHLLLIPLMCQSA